MNPPTPPTEQRLASPTPTASAATPGARRRPFWQRRGVRTSAQALALVAIAATVVFRLKFAAVPVLAHTAGPGTVVTEVLGTGTLEARVQATVSAKIAGRLRAVLADQNDTVAAGQLLAELDDAELGSQVAIAQAGLAAAQAGVERARADEARAHAVLRQAQLDDQRTLELLTNRVASAAEADKTREHLHISEAEVKRAQAAVVEAERQVVTAEKTLTYQQERLADARLHAPFDGLVVRRHREPGDVAVPGSAVLTLASTNELWIAAWVDETAMTGLAPGQPARVVFRAEPDRTYPGEVSRLGRQTDRETREFQVDVRVKALPPNWALGQRAEVWIETGRRAAPVTVPAAFVRWREGHPGLLVNQHGRARWRPVDLGVRGAHSVEIRSGVAAGERVVRPVEPARQDLADGARVKES